MTITIRHNSWNLKYRSPFGALSCGSAVQLHLEIQPPQNAAVTLHVRTMHGDSTQTMLPETGDETKQLYAASLTMPELPGILYYYFSLNLDQETIFFGNNEELTGGRGMISATLPPPFRITVYHLAGKTPAWFKETILYQIYVDRFQWAGSAARGEGLPPKSLLHLDWQDVPFYIRDPQTQAIRRWDFFGGNLDGVVQELPYLQSLGVGCLYFNPVFRANSNHKYDTADYLAIDPGYGGEAAFDRLVSAADQAGMRVFLDGVFSHTGSDSIYFNQEGNYPGIGASQSKDSPYYPWYQFNSYPDDYQSWWGIKSLPNVWELETSYLEFILHGEDSVIRHWMKRGVGGWRLDVADELPDDFIKQLRTVVKEMDPQGVVLGEVWEDASQKFSYDVLREYLGGDELDSVTNYPFRSLILDFLLRKKDARQTGRHLMSLFENYPKENFYALLNCTGSHDLPRILTQLGEAPAEESLVDWDRAEYRLPPEQRRLGLLRLRLFALIMFTFPGVPGIYYGDEAGMEGFKDPYNRGPFPWGREETDLQDWFRRLAQTRQSQAALRTGELFFLNGGADVFCLLRVISGGQDVFGQARADGIFLIVANAHPVESRQVNLNLQPWGGGKLSCLLSSLAQTAAADLPGGQLSLELLPLQGMLFRLERG